MKIQISPVRIVKDALVIWNEQTPDVDIIFKDLKALGFPDNSVDELYVFHVFEHLFESEIPAAVENWRTILKPNALVYLVADDYEFLCRAFVGGEFDIDSFNKDFSYPTKISKDNIIKYMEGAGFSQHDMSFWYVDVPNLFPKKEYEIVVSAKKI